MIRFTKHAIERINERGIRIEDIIDCVKYPDQTTVDKYGNEIAQKRKIITC